MQLRIRHNFGHLNENFSIAVVTSYSRTYWNIFVPTSNHISLSKKQEARVYRKKGNQSKGDQDMKLYFLRYCCFHHFKLWNLSVPKSSLSSIHVVKTFLKQTLMSLLRTTFDVESPCTWSLARSCACHRS